MNTPRTDALCTNIVNLLSHFNKESNSTKETAIIAATDTIIKSHKELEAELIQAQEENKELEGALQRSIIAGEMTEEDMK